MSPEPAIAAMRRANTELQLASLAARTGRLGSQQQHVSQARQLMAAARLILDQWERSLPNLSR